MRSKVLVLLAALLYIVGCSKEETTAIDDAIVGQWFLVQINETSVANLECYEESYIRTNGETIDFYLLDRQADGSCETVLDRSDTLTIEEGFYFIGDEAIELYVEGNQLTWRVNVDTNLVFQKQ